MMSASYPTEPEHYDQGLIERHYAGFDTGEDGYRFLVGWRHEWEKRLKETSGFYQARPPVVSAATGGCDGRD